MKIFIDTADINEIKTAASWGVIEGVTTNPTLMARTQKPFEQIVDEIVKVVNGPISVETIADNASEIIEEAKKLAAIHENIVVKIPATKEGLKAVKELSRMENPVKTNVTLVFSPTQALLAMKAGATYISPFLGRMEDHGYNAKDMLQKTLQIAKVNNFKSKILAASIRDTEQVECYASLGVDAITIPFRIIEKMFHHELTDEGIKKFKNDFKKIPNG